MNPSNAVLRVCASCEWIFKSNEKNQDCPKCGFAHYGARDVYGNKAYRYAKTQEKWIERKMNKYYLELVKEVEKAGNMGKLTKFERFLSVDVFEKYRR